MSTPALLAYVDELLTEPSGNDDSGPSPASRDAGVLLGSGGGSPPASRDAFTPVVARTASPAAPVAAEPSRCGTAQLAHALAEKVAAATSSPAPTGRWLRMTVDSDHYAVELLRVQEVTRMAPIVAMRGAATAVLGAMNLRGRIVPVFDLGRWLGAGEVVPDERARIVVVERSDELIGLLVTAVDDVFPLVEGAVEDFRVPGPQRRNIDRAFLGVARPANLPTVLLDAGALFG